jgi:hypothetical protein
MLIDFGIASRIAALRSGLALLLASTAACGAHTGFDYVQPSAGGAGRAEAGADADDGAASEGDAGGGGDGVLCSLYAGPVASCDAGTAAGPVQRCPSHYPVCAEEFPPLWGCCIANPPGGMDNCIYQQELDAACF